MLSLDKTKDLNEIVSFITEHDWICMAKMDGLTCSLTYRGGRLVRAETRGNGVIGEDITHNAYVISSIPKTIPIKEECIIDGEVICTYENFKAFENDYSNPRNFAAGSIRLLDNKECEKRNLTFVAWDWIKGWETDGFTMENNTLSNKLFLLKEIGFSVVPWTREGIEYGSNLDDSMKIVKGYAQKESYPIDGLVFKYNDCEEYEAAGRTEHHFRGGLAYKFYDELYETTLEDIEWSMGRTGVLTPVAIFKEIEIDGAKVSRASLHNIGIMNELLGQPFFGQKLRIFRANQIIPQVYDAEDSPYTISTMRILNCPICGELLKINNNDGVLTLVCPNENCEGKLLNKLDHFCGKKGLDIKGLSKATLEKLMNWNWVNNIEDIFELHTHRSEWIKKEGFGIKSVDNILSAIEASKHCELPAFISSLGIPLIGLSVAKELTKIFDSYESFREAVAVLYDFSQHPNFGYEKTLSLLNFDYTSADTVRTYLFLTNENSKNITETLKGLTICVTGKLQLHKNRAELKALVEKNGGKLTDSVSSKTNYLVNNDINSTSSKNITAKKLGVPIITEQQLIDLLN
jgi:DNA ligase (NAD+)